MYIICLFNISYISIVYVILLKSIAYIITMHICVSHISISLIIYITYNNRFYIDVGHSSKDTTFILSYAPHNDSVVLRHSYIHDLRIRKFESFLKIPPPVSSRARNQKSEQFVYINLPSWVTYAKLKFIHISFSLKTNVNS